MQCICLYSYLMLRSSPVESVGHNNGIPDPCTTTVLHSGDWQRLFWPVWLLLSGLQRTWTLKGDSQQAQPEGLRRIQVSNFHFFFFFSNVHNTQTALIGYALEICTNFTCPTCSKVALYVTLTPQILEHVSCLANDLVSDSNQGCTRREG